MPLAVFRSGSGVSDILPATVTLGATILRLFFFKNWGGLRAPEKLSRRFESLKERLFWDPFRDLLGTQSRKAREDISRLVEGIGPETPVNGGLNLL